MGGRLRPRGLRVSARWTYETCIGGGLGDAQGPALSENGTDVIERRRRDEAGRWDAEEYASMGEWECGGWERGMS